MTSRLEIPTPTKALIPMAVYTQRTCATCTHAARDATSNMAMCGRDPDPVSGKPVRFCATERLVGTPEKTVAIKAAESLQLCGPLGTHWEEFVAPPPPSRWVRLGHFWAFWRT